MPDLNTKIDIWKNKLLDMSLRNRLLNYRETKRSRSTLWIKKPDIYSLWDSFVLNEEPLVFPLIDEDQEDNQTDLSVYKENTDKESEEIDSHSSSSDSLGGSLFDSNQLITNQNANDRQKTLESLRSKSRSFIEEQGINTLYLCFGFLQWAESTNSQVTHNAPLILVPVTMKWESILSPYILELHEDEIVVNSTLLYKLENDFGIKLPGFDTDTPIEEFFTKVEEITAQNHWTVLREVSLGLLSFSKINMYQDLEVHRDNIIANPVIQAISGDSSGIIHDITDFDHYDFDHKTKPEETYQVVDADSSQQDAILCAKNGISFVLQGPPGTGKSQTITNIIAECLAEGKKVLFVSEKMAALDIVYQRLTKANLADFCLVLHSHKTNKKQTLDQLRDVLSLTEKKVSVSDEAYQSLERLLEDRNKLNQYTEEVYEVVEPLHKSIYKVNGILASLQNYEDLIFTVPDVRQTTAQQYGIFINNLNRFAETVSMQEVDFHINPWRGATVETVTNEFRHDLNARLNPLRDSIDQLEGLFTNICKELSFIIPNNYASVEKLLTILNIAKEGVPFQSDWILNDEVDILFREIAQCDDLKKDFLQKREEILKEVQLIEENDSEIDLSKYSKLSTSTLLKDFSNDLDEITEKDMCYHIWQEKSNYEHMISLCDEARSLMESYNDQKQSVLAEYEKEIFEIEFNEIYFRFKSKSTSAVKFFNRQYRADKKLIRNMHRDMKQLTDEDILSILSTLRDMQDQKKWFHEHHMEFASICPGFCKDEETDFDSLKKHITAFDAIIRTKDMIDELQSIVEKTEELEEQLKGHYHQQYSGIETDWESVRISLAWANLFAYHMDGLLSENELFVTRLSDDQVMAENCGNLANNLSASWELTIDDFTWFSELFESDQDFKNMPLPALTERLNACCEHLAALEEWNDYKSIKKECCEIGLDSYMEVLDNHNLKKEHIVPVFKKRFFRLWLDSVLSEYPAVKNFRRKIQDNNLEEFRSLDKSQFDIASARIRQKLINSLPSMDHFTSGIDEISILKRELNKRRKLMPIRRLFKKIPNLIMTLKPCLMMSPLSVSLYLESDSYVFDTVIFDEASQVFTENAIGSIFRGKQVIIAGDSKQLPPTNFFNVTSENIEFDIEEESEEQDDSSSFESILDEAALLPERILLWHYRSKHEHLITFSNVKIYHNNLITFPSSIDKTPDLGVEYIYVENGYYDRGGKKGNVIEAQKIAEMIIDHFSKYPDRSLGVITFGERQQQAIDTALRKLRQENTSYESFFDENKNEPFFIKSLENVQGDERDTIILSIGYGKDANGVMRMNFGPLGANGGERRLNVAITRAKCNFKLVGSILPTDIDLSRVTNEGPKLLRSYIEFAINGPSSLANEIIENDNIWFDSPFEESVYQFLDKKGYKLATQVGCSGYRIDIAVKHPTLSGRYVLGIECDGATYHSARTARERDRLRQDVLESIGWKIYRIWSTDWIKDPVTEGNRLIEEIENALSEYHENETVNVVAPVDKKYEKDNIFLTVEDKSVDAAKHSNPYNFENFPDLDLQTFYIPDASNLYEYLINIIETVYPVHLDEICQIIAPLLGRVKVTSTVKTTVLVEFSKIVGQYIERDKFYFPMACNIHDLYQIPHRLAGKRDIKHINLLELASGMLAVATACVGVTKEGLITETVRAFGFNRKGNNIINAMNRAYSYLEEHHYISVVNGKIEVMKDRNKAE